MTWQVDQDELVTRSEQVTDGAPSAARAASSVDEQQRFAVSHPLATQAVDEGLGRHGLLESSNLSRLRRAQLKPRTCRRTIGGVPG
jgi:hypothetical protein